MSTNSNHEPMLQFFTFEHLPADAREVAAPFDGLAKQIVDMLPRNPERTVALRKLLEARECAIRAKRFQSEPPRPNPGTGKP